MIAPLCRIFGRLMRRSSPRAGRNIRPMSAEDRAVLSELHRRRLARGEGQGGK